MAYKNFDELSSVEGTQNTAQTLDIANGETQLPDSTFIKDANIVRDGADLILDGPNGTITVTGYFTAETQPTLTAPDGASLSPQLVNSFAQSNAQYAQAATMNDESPIGQVEEMSGDATITRLSGEIETLQIGTPVYEGDIIETAANGAVNVLFEDESSFAVSEDTRLAIDEYVYDATGGGEGVQNFSVLKGVFVFTSGLVGRDDPDDVSIETPSGSIGIRGTVIAGDVNEGEITVVEGAIVLRDNFGNEQTLANQFETAKFMSGEQGIQHMGELSAGDMNAKFAGVSKVAPAMFSSINDAAGEDSQGSADGNAPDAAKEAPAEAEAAAEDTPQDSGEELQNPDEAGEKPAAPDEAQAEEAKPQAEANPDGSLDQNGDNQVDGTIEEVAQDTGEGNKPAMMQMMKASMAEQMMENMQNANGDQNAIETIQDFMDANDVTPQEVQAILEARADAANADESGNNGEGETAGGDETLPPPPPPEGADNTGPNPIRIDTLQQNTTTGVPTENFYMADQGGVQYQGTLGNDQFTNSNSTQGFEHQHLSVATGAGADQVHFKSLLAAAGPLPAGSLNVGFIDTGTGDDDIKLDFSNGFTAGGVNIGSIHGGAGTDTLKIQGNASGVALDFDNIGNLQGIEVIDLIDGANTAITLTSDLILQNTSTLANDGGGVLTGTNVDLSTHGLSNPVDFSSSSVLKIKGDASGDSVNVDLTNNGWVKLGAGEEINAGGSGLAGSHDIYYHEGAHSTLIVEAPLTGGII